MKDVTYLMSSLFDKLAQLMIGQALNSFGGPFFLTKATFMLGRVSTHFTDIIAANLL